MLHYVFKVSDADATLSGEVDTSKKFVEVIPREYKEILAYLEGNRTIDTVLKEEVNLSVG